MSDLAYGFIENVARAFNLSPADAERAIREAQHLTGGPTPFRWYSGEVRRLREHFHDDDAATEGELLLLLTLAQRADKRGRTVISRAELAEIVGCTEREIGGGITWGIWRDSFAALRVSAKSRPPVYKFILHGWPQTSAR